MTGNRVTGSGASGTSLAAPQLDALTGIRGLAAWAVVLFHLRVSLLKVLPGWAMAVAAKGYLAVDLFFMLSGFVLWYNYAERLRTGGWAATAQFWWRRIARIWPLHFVILTLFVGYALLAVLRGHDGGHYPFAQLPLHYLLIQNWGFTRELAWNDPAWSISTELAAYILFPAVVMACRWGRLGWPALAAIAALLLLALYRLIAGNEHASLGADIPALGLRRCGIEFALGNIVCIVWQRWRGHAATAPLAARACGTSSARPPLTGLRAAPWRPGTTSTSSATTSTPTSSSPTPTCPPCARATCGAWCRRNGATPSTRCSTGTCPRSTACSRSRCASRTG